MDYNAKLRVVSFSPSPIQDLRRISNSLAHPGKPVKTHSVYLSHFSSNKRYGFIVPDHYNMPYENFPEGADEIVTPRQAGEMRLLSIRNGAIFCTIFFGADNMPPINRQREVSSSLSRLFSSME